MQRIVRGLIETIICATGELFYQYDSGLGVWNRLLTHTFDAIPFYSFSPAVKITKQSLATIWYNESIYVDITGDAHWQCRAPLYRQWPACDNAYPFAYIVETISQQEITRIHEMFGAHNQRGTHLICKIPLLIKDLFTIHTDAIASLRNLLPQHLATLRRYLLPELSIEIVRIYCEVYRLNDYRDYCLLIP